MSLATSTALAAADQLRAGMRGLLESDLTGLDSTDITELLREVEAVTRQAGAVDARLLNEIELRGLTSEGTRILTTDVLVTGLRVSPAEARARLRRAGDVGPRIGLTGEPLPALCPRTAEAQQRGEISQGHVDAIRAGLAKIDRVDDITVETMDLVEKLLVEVAQHETPASVARAAEAVLYRLDQDGAAPRDDELERRRGVSLTLRPDGSSRISGDLSAMLTAELQTVFDALAAPRPTDESGPDPRTCAQRNHDALQEVVERVLRSGTLPESGGVPATVVIHASAEHVMRNWEARHGQPLLDGHLTATPGRLEARVNATDTNALAATINQRDRILRGTTSRNAPITASGWVLDSVETQYETVVEGDYGGLLAFARVPRKATPQQRRALRARDRGCCFPGCTRPAAWTEAHHIRPWSPDGRTDIINLCLVCKYHHQYFEVGGWEIVMIGGMPHWIPPAYLDPSRIPRRNTAHHPPDIEFAEVILQRPSVG